ncbi:MAG: hypothetical protein KF819_02340 [Labilithrix sp.]|nr:hypothetical protein [Labilithrix sp.]
MGPAIDASSSCREHMLDATALDAARAWIEHLVEELSREGRAIEGGWPGTINEARGRCGSLAARALAVHAMPALDRDELGRLTRIAYDEARRLWRASEKT